MATNLANLSAELDYVDQAARDVLERNTRDAYNRIANERRDELDRVLRRVEHICSNFENYEAFGNGKTSTVQFVSGLAELEKIVNDPQSKKKYLDDVTIFVVGFENKCSTRLHLIEQVSEFLLENEALFDTDLKNAEPVDFEELNVSVESTIASVSELNARLGDLHKGVVEGLTAHFNSKGAQKQKKKLEKELETARKELGDLSEKLMHLNSELQERDVKAQLLTKQLESKNAELQKLRAAVEINKTAATQLAELQAELQKRTADLDSMKASLERLRLDAGEEKHRDQVEIELLREQNKTMQAELDVLKAHLSDTQNQFRESQNSLQELQLENENRMAKLAAKFKRQIASAKRKHDGETAKLQAELRKAYAEMSRAETEFDENKQTVFVDDDPEQQPISRMQSEADVMDFDTAIDFADDGAWDSVPRSHRRGRFAQYRELAKAQLTQVVEQQRRRSDEKILRLKSQFNEFKAQWDEERAGLELSIREAERETEDAKRKAELAVRKLEELYDRFKETQNLSSADSSELQVRIGQLQVDKTQLETRVEDLDHEVRVLNQLLKQASKEKEVAERMLAAAQAAPPVAQHEPTTRNTSEVETRNTSDLPSDTGESENADIPFPEDDDMPGLHLADHPIVSEFMRTYNHVMKSKTRLSELLSENDAYKEVASNLSTLGDVGIQLDRETKITPQIEDLGRNLTFVSDQIFLLVENVILTVENQKRQNASAPAPAQQEEESAAAKEKHDELMRQIEDLKNKYLSVGRMLQEKEQRFKTDMDERNLEIQSLQQSVAQLRAEVDRLRAEQQVDLQNSLMFTKLDAERNAKTLKRALASRRIGEAAYETALEAMEEYSSVPARRLLAISQRMMQGQLMAQLQTAIELSGVEGDITSERARLLLGRLQEFEGRSTRRYEQIMDHLREERLRLARGLVDTFEDVGESCSIFLIKPVLSLRHRENLEQHLRTVMERNRRAAAQRSIEEDLSARRRAQLDGPQRGARLSPCPEESADDRLPGIAGSAMKQDSSLSDVWNVHASTDMRMLPAGFDRSLLNTPRLLEMDVNKILLGQNRISASFDASKEGGSASESGAIAGSGGLRYYVPLKRRSLDNYSTTMHELSGPPPTTPALMKKIPGISTAPLPPIKSKTHS